MTAHYLAKFQNCARFESACNIMPPNDINDLERELDISRIRSYFTPSASRKAGGSDLGGVKRIVFDRHQVMYERIVLNRHKIARPYWPAFCSGFWSGLAGSFDGFAECGFKFLPPK
jgi:hypothetical protein